MAQARPVQAAIGLMVHVLNQYPCVTRQVRREPHATSVTVFGGSAC